MHPPIPTCCNSRAFNELASLVGMINSPDALIYGAVAISRHCLDSVMPTPDVDATLQSYADRVRTRVHGLQSQALLAHLHKVLFEEEGYCGEVAGPSLVAARCVPEVIRSRRGLPISLNLIYKVVAERVGFRTWGIPLPGRFLCGIEVNGLAMFVDPGNGGRIVDRNEMLKHYRSHEGPEAEWSDELLSPVTNLNWLTRMLQELLYAYHDCDHFNDVAAIIEMEMVLWPKFERLQRDLALVLIRCGLSEPAHYWLDLYLRQHPDDPQHAELSGLLDVIG